MDIDLQQFCHKGIRLTYDIGKPFTIGGTTYATDAAILVAVETHGEPSVGKFPNVAKMLSAHWPKGDFSPWLSSADFKESVECEVCDGHGKQRCPHCGDGHSDRNCESCGGRGSDVQVVKRRVGSVKVEERYFQMVAALPGPVMCRRSNEPSCVAFTFDGGRGLLMGVTE